MRLQDFLREEDDEFEFNANADGGEAEMTAVEANPEAGEEGAQIGSIRSILKQGIEEIGQAMADGVQDYDDDLTSAVVDKMTAEIADLFVDAPDEDVPDEEPPVGAEEPTEAEL